MDNSEYIVGIAIIIVVVLFIATTIIGYYISKRNNNGALAVITTNGSFLSSCTTTTCQNGLICDGTTFLCKLSPNSVCNNSDDCTTGLICSGTCATGPTGGLNQLCPCEPGYLCTSQLNSSKTICKGGTGTICVNNDDCASNICINTGCAGGSPNSSVCTNNTQCGSGNCNNGFCQPLGKISGVLGSSCAGICVGFTGSSCIGTISQPLSCSCLEGQGNPGTCVAATQGTLSTCSTNTLCSDELICFNNTASTCQVGQTGCICLFPYDNPNIIQQDNICITGMSERNNACYNNNGLGCNSSGLCFGNSCGGPSVLAVYRFSRPEFPDLRTRFLNATSTEIMPIVGPTGIISPYKMFSTSNGDVDNIFLIDNIQGFLTFTYNPITSTILFPWQIIIPKVTTTTTTTRTLIDVSFNGILYLIVFDEIVNNTGQRNNTVYTGNPSGVITPFNVTTGSGILGTQYNTSGVALTIDYIDLSKNNNISSGNDVLISSGGVIYVKRNNESFYSISVIQGGPRNGQLMTNTIGVSRFYFDLTQNTGGTGQPVCPENGTSAPIACPSYFNISFIAPFPQVGQQVLQYSGNIAGVAQPADRFNNLEYRVFDYDIYSPQDTGMVNSSIIMLANTYRNNIFIEDVVAISYGGNTTIIPYRIGQNSRSVVSNNAFYIISTGSCN